MVKTSTMTRNVFAKDIEEWIEIFGFSEQKDEFELFLVLFRTSISYGLALEERVLLRWIDILMQKSYNISFVFDFWDQIRDKETKLDYYTRSL